MSQDLDRPELYFNRELSALQFNVRVLEQSVLEHHPLLERLKFLLIFSKNMDELFEIRVAKLMRALRTGTAFPTPDRMTPEEVLEAISVTAHEAVNKQYQILNEQLLPEMRTEGIAFLAREEWSDEQRHWLKQYFRREVLPVITPIALDPAHPFPRLVNKQLNFLVELDGKDAFGRSIQKAVVPAPRSLPRLIELPSNLGSYEKTYVFLSSIIHDNVDTLFAGVNVGGCHQFRITRDMDLDFGDGDIEQDLGQSMSEKLESHGYGNPLRLECSDTMPADMVTFLQHHFGILERETYLVKGPVNVARLFEVTGLPSHKAHQYPDFFPGSAKALSGNESMFDVLKEQDVLLMHPFQSFQPVVDLILQAAEDPKVLAIRQTLYRTGAKSPIVDALVKAAKSGKEVTAVVEIRARFDEEPNLQLAQRLQDAGAQIVYGVVGYKTHSKMLLILRQEDDGLRHYAHLGTGNYHAGTAKLYTDYSLMTANPNLTEDVRKLFHQLTGMGKALRIKNILHAPFTLRKTIVKMCEREAENAKAGKPARIVAKINSLNEANVIKALYAASQAGVKIELIVRGICALKPGIPGVSENITIRSVVGRFLEHTRVYYFHNDGEPEVYCASADWMNRNLNSRVETCFPILDPKLHKRVVEELEYYLSDNSESWELDSEGNYVLNAPRKNASVFSAQSKLLETLSKR